MNLYKLSFTSSGAISVLPDSQKIFGTICSSIKASKGDEKLCDYFASFESDPYLIHSSMFIDGTMPMIRENIFDIVSVNETVRNQKPEEKLAVLSQLKTYKRVRAVSERVFDEYILTGDTARLKEDILKNEKFTIKDFCLCFSDEIMNASAVTASFYRTRRDIMADESDEGRLFRDTVVYYPSETKFSIFVKTKLSRSELEDIFKLFNYLPAGNKGSIGRNLFQLENIEELNKRGSGTRKVILSGYIPKENEFDADKSFYELTGAVHIANPNHQGSIFSRKILHFREGSFMKFNEDKDFYGQVISYQAGNERQYHYGIGFVV